MTGSSGLTAAEARAAGGLLSAAWGEPAGSLAVEAVRRAAPARALAELRAREGRAGSGGSRSPQERQIPSRRRGPSNREIGQRLYLSHRTIGSHLYRIFPKLGITSRAQLGSALADG